MIDEIVWILGRLGLARLAICFISQQNKNKRTVGDSFGLPARHPATRLSDDHSWYNIAYWRCGLSSGPGAALWLPQRSRRQQQQQQQQPQKQQPRRQENNNNNNDDDDDDEAEDEDDDNDDESHVVRSGGASTTQHSTATTTRTTTTHRQRLRRTMNSKTAAFTEFGF